MTLVGEGGVDGRRLRRERNVQIERAAERSGLFAEDILVPTIERAAERSGLSLRSVYSYFPDWWRSSPPAVVGSARTRTVAMPKGSAPRANSSAASGKARFSSAPVATTWTWSTAMLASRTAVASSAAASGPAGAGRGLLDSRGWDGATHPAGACSSWPAWVVP